MIDANRGMSEEVLQQHKQASYERFRTQFALAVEQKLIDFEMTWDELYELMYPDLNKGWGFVLKQKVKAGDLSAEDMNDITHIFSCEPYVVFRPREPWTQT